MGSFGADFSGAGMNFRKKASAVAVAGALATVTTLVAGGLPAAAQAAPASAASDAPITHEENPRVPEGAAWTEAYFPSADHRAELHADVLRPANLAPGAKTPVILAVGPYFAHIGQT